MLKRWQFWALTLLAASYVAAVAANMWIFQGNRALQAEVNQRAQFVQQTAPVEQLARDVALALAQLGVRNQDPQIRSMLSGLGITVNQNENPPVASGGAVPAPADGKRK